jgi:hypothetical protein
MTASVTRELNLSDLTAGIDAINPVIGAFLAQACAVCLDRHNHQTGIALTVNGEFDETFALHWNVSTELERRGFDTQEPTHFGACCVAVLLIRELTNYTVIERACIGTGIDYWLGNKNELPFQQAARLEVSGIGAGDDREIKKRVKEKLAQTKPSDGTLPAYVIVVEFSSPKSQLVKK